MNLKNRQWSHLSRHIGDNLQKKAAQVDMHMFRSDIRFLDHTRASDTSLAAQKIHDGRSLTVVRKADRALGHSHYRCLQYQLNRGRVPS